MSRVFAEGGGLFPALAIANGALVAGPGVGGAGREALPLEYENAHPKVTLALAA